MHIHLAMAVGIGGASHLRFFQITDPRLMRVNWKERLAGVTLDGKAKG